MTYHVNIMDASLFFFLLRVDNEIFMVATINWWLGVTEVALDVRLVSYGLRYLI